MKTIYIYAETSEQKEKYEDVKRFFISSTLFDGTRTYEVSFGEYPNITKVRGTLKKGDYIGIW